MDIARKVGLSYLHDFSLSNGPKIYRLGSQEIDESTVNAIPGANTGDGPSIVERKQGRRQLTSSLLAYPLPSFEIMEMLLDQYFSSVHWFSLVIYEPRFRGKFNSIHDGYADPKDKPFLALLSIMLAMSALYVHMSETHGDDSSEFWRDLSANLLKNAELELINLMDRNCLSSVQTLILLGSYYVYHGRPNLSFSLLGATTRAAQAMGLHRERNGSFDEVEERKRVWWTIYTWDR